MSHPFDPEVARGESLDRLVLVIGAVRKCHLLPREQRRWWHVLWLKPWPHEHNAKCETDSNLRARVRDMAGGF